MRTISSHHDFTLGAGMSSEPSTDERRHRTWVERYRELRRRVERLEAMYEDRERLDQIIAKGRYLKLAYATARSDEQNECELARATADET